MKQNYPKPHKTTSPKHNEDYIFVEVSGEDFTGLKLISGPFASIAYKYGNVGFAPESEAVGDKLIAARGHLLYPKLLLWTP